MLQRKMHF